MFNILSLGSNFYDAGHNLISGFNLFNRRSFEDDAGRETENINKQAKKLSWNNTFISSTSRAYRKGICSVRFNIQSRTQFTEFNKLYESEIKLHSKRGNCELTGRYHRGSFERMMIDEFAVKSGGFIIRHHFNSKWVQGYKYELVTLSTIDTTKHNVLNRLLNGIQLNSDGEIKSIWLFNSKDRLVSKEVRYKDLTLVVNQWADPTQYSGVSPLATILEALAYVDQYKSSEMAGAKQKADNPMLIKTPYFSDLVKADSVEKKKPLSMDSIRELFSLRRLDNKEEVRGFTYIDENEEVFEIGKSTSIYADMYQNETQGASSSVGLTSTSTSGATPSTYVATLKGSQDEELEFKVIFEDVIELVWREVYEIRLLNALIVKDRIKIDSYFSNPEPYRKIEFMRKEREHVDPTKNAKTITENTTVNGSSTLIDELAKKGIDYQEHLEKKTVYAMAELQEQIKIKKAYEDAGINYPKSVISIISDEDLKSEDK